MVENRKEGDPYKKLHECLLITVGVMSTRKPNSVFFPLSGPTHIKVNRDLFLTTMPCLLLTLDHSIVMTAIQCVSVLKTVFKPNESK